MLNQSLLNDSSIVNDDVDFPVSGLEPLREEEEAVAMACADVIGNDVTVSIGSQSGNFQLNVMLPVIAYNLLKSICLMSNSMPLLANKAIKTFKVNKKNIAKSLGMNPIFCY